jgi:parallel beta-helix repeat protein
MVEKVLKSMTKFFALTFLMIAIPSSIPVVCAEDITVDVNGSEKYISIQTAINESSNGDNIIVLSGVYIENLVIDKPLTVTSKTGDPTDVTIKAPLPDVVAVKIDANNTVFKGITVASYYNLGQDYGIVIMDNENITVKNNILTGCKKGITIIRSYNCTIEDNYMEGKKGGTGIDLYLAGNNLIRRNTIIKSGGAIWEDYCEIGNVYQENNLSDNWNGITLIHDSDNSVVYDNLIQGNENDGVSISWADNNVIMNNWIIENGQGINIYDSKYNNISSNVVMDNQCGMEFASAYSNLIYNNYFRNQKNIAWGDGFNTWNVSKTPGKNIIGESYVAGNCWLNADGNGISHELSDLNGDGICDEGYDVEFDGWDYLPLKDNGKIPKRNKTEVKQAPINFDMIINALLLAVFFVKRRVNTNYSIIQANLSESK